MTIHARVAAEEKLFSRPGALAPGEPADLVLFEHGPGAEFQVQAVVIGGRRVTA